MKKKDLRSLAFSTLRNECDKKATVRAHGSKSGDKPIRSNEHMLAQSTELQLKKQEKKNSAKGVVILEDK